MAFNSILARFKKLSFFDTFKHASTFFSGTMLIHGLGLVSLPVFTAYLTRDEYGIINIFTSCTVFLAVLLSLNLHWAISRYYFEKDKDDFDTFLGTIFVAVTALFGLLGAILYGFREPLMVKLNLPVHLLGWMIGVTYLLILASFFEQIMVSTKQSKKLTTVQVVIHYTRFAFTCVGLIYLTGVTYMHAGQVSSYTYMGKIMGELLASSLIMIYMFSQVLRYMSFKKLSFSYIKYALFYGLPLIPFALSNHILIFFDQIFIGATVGNAQAGEYAFAYKIGMLFMGLATALLNGSQANYYKLMNNEQYKEVSDQVNSMTKLLALGGCFLILFAIDLGTLLSSSDVFLNALPIAPVIIGSYLFYGVSSFYNRGIYYKKQNKYLAIIIVITGAINVSLNVYFIPIYGYQAAAYTTLCSYLVMMVLSIVMTTYILKLPPLPLGRILKYIVLLGGIVGLNYIVGEPNVGLHIGWMCFKALLFVCMGAILFYNKIGFFFKKSTPNDILDGPDED